MQTYKVSCLLVKAVSIIGMIVDGVICSGAAASNVANVSHVLLTPSQTPSRHNLLQSFIKSSVLFFLIVVLFFCLTNLDSLMPLQHLNDNMFTHVPTCWIHIM